MEIKPNQPLINSIKQDIIKIEWFSEVQDDVKNSLDWIIDNIDEIGSYFSSTFMAIFRWEYERRSLKKQLTSPMAGVLSVLLGMHISEEAFLCGKLPTRVMLDLYDYVEPTDSDVAICLYLCHKIDTLEKSGALTHVREELKTTPIEMINVLKQAQLKKPKGKSTLEEDPENFGKFS